MPSAAACALATKTQSIGAGVFNPYGRHPTLIAMEVGALDELSGGRVRLGVGSGLGHAVERMGFSTKKSLTNFELVATWRHLKHAGNSGIFVWASAEALKDLKPNTLPPGGIEPRRFHDRLNEP